MAKLTGADPGRMRSEIRFLTDDHRLPGISTGVVSSGELMFSEGFGLADIESVRPKEPVMRQRFGSIKRTIV